MADHLNNKRTRKKKKPISRQMQPQISLIRNWP